MIDKIEKFQDAVKNIIGRKCWAICAGEGTGSTVGIYIGDKILRKKN